MQPVISVERLSKSYRLGQIGTGTLSDDLKVWWSRLGGKPNPLLKIGQTDHGNQAGETIWALKDVSFKVEQGEVLGIIGRNGAGKSTLLKILSRVTAPTSGVVKVKGRIASLLEVGTGFHPDLTGRENIYLNGAILGMTREEVQHKFDEIVTFAEIEKFIDTPVKRYSSGMYVRLAFAVAAHLESEILLIDEVLAVGDTEFQKKCLGKMGDAAKGGRTILFVSHNMGALLNLCTRGICLRNSEISSIGEIQPVIEDYINILQMTKAVGNKYIDITSLKIINRYIEKDPKMNAGFEIEAVISGKWRNPTLIFIIENAKGQTILHQKRTGSQINLTEFDGEVVLRISYPPLFLASGTYSVYLKLLNLLGGRESRVVSDQIPLSIIGNVDGTGEAIIDPEGIWSLNPGHN